MNWKFAAIGAALLAMSAALTAQDDPTEPIAPPACEAEEAAFVMPGTAALFTLPTDDTVPCPSLSPPPIRPAAPNLFSMVALPLGNAGPADKWEAARLANLSGVPGAWSEMLSETRRLAADPLVMVNRWVNWHVRFRDDEGGDEWAEATLTLARGFGDCEDFALAKMALLAELGVPPGDMYLVLLRDQRQGDHAVLAVNREGRLYVLDNRTDKVLPADEIADYTPVLSFSGPFAWTYGERRLSTR